LKGSDPPFAEEARKAGTRQNYFRQTPLLPAKGISALLVAAFKAKNWSKYPVCLMRILSPEENNQAARDARGVTVNYLIDTSLSTNSE